MHRIEDPRLARAEQELGQLLTQFVGAPITQGVVKAMEDMIVEFRASQIIRGVKFPKLAVVALPQSGYIQCWPQDLSEKELKKRIKLMIKTLQERGRDPQAEEIAAAIKRAYPDYNPSTSRLIH